MLGRGHDGLYNASTNEDRRKRTAKRESDQITFIDLGFERWQVVRFWIDHLALGNLHRLVN